MEPILAHAICRCPFLGELARRNGAEYAKSIAVNPTVPAASGVETGCSGRRPVLEDYESYELTFRAFHGPRGVCPLQNRSPVPVVSPPTHSTQPPVLQEPSPTSCAVIIGGVPELPQRARRAGSGGVQQAYNVPCSSAAARALHPQAGTAAATAAPFATLSMSFGRNLPDFGKMLARALAQQEPQGKPRTSRKPPGSGSGGKPPSSRQGSSARPKGPGSRAMLQQKGSGTPSAGGGGQCPLRKLLGPAAPVIFNAKGHLQCPAPIIKARAMLASTQPVRLLRPQALPAKLAAVGATSMAVNVPCGMWREHCEKFSGHWFLAVHASIPFIAMLRKAVIMPKFAILFSIATAIAGQTIGSRLERRRIAPLKPASLTASSLPALNAVAAPAPTPSQPITLRGSGSSSGSKPGCNGAQLAALEYFSSLEQSDGASGSEAVCADSLPLAFQHARCKQRGGLGGGCRQQPLVLAGGSGQSWQGPANLTLVS